MKSRGINKGHRSRGLTGVRQRVWSLLARPRRRESRPEIAIILPRASEGPTI
jgi:hypothetical protein